MIITGFGVTLIRLQHADIEMVRVHRNSPEISQFMEFRQEISKEQQEIWFQSINTKFNNYFIIDFRGIKIGLIYGAGINWETKETLNGGIFIWDQKWMETPVPLSASLLLTEISFLLGLERTYIKVLRDNLRAIAFNKNLGYTLLPDQETILNQSYVLTKENYYKKAERFRESFVKMHGDVFTMTIDHSEDESERNIAAVYYLQPEENKKRLKLILR
jgi:RimJ/RimL family protein N-acetyltransferase